MRRTGCARPVSVRRASATVAGQHAPAPASTRRPRPTLGRHGRYSQRMDRQTLLGNGFAAAAAILFGTAYVATAIALRSFSPVAVALWRGVGAAAVLALVLVVRRRTTWPALRHLDRGAVLRLGILGTFGGPAFLAGMNVAVAAAGATVAAFVAGLYAVLAAVFAPWILRERLGWQALVGFVLALAGTALLSELDPRSGSAFGVAAGLGAAVAFALYLVLSRRWTGGLGRMASTPARPTSTAGARSAVGRPLPGDLVALALFAMLGLVLLPVELLVEPRAIVPPAIAPEALAALGWLVVGPSLLAQLLLQASVRRVRARHSAAFLLLNPISASILAALLLGERLSPAQVGGAVLVLAGIGISSGLRLARPRRPDWATAVRPGPDSGVGGRRDPAIATPDEGPGG